MSFNDKHPELEDGEMFLTNERMETCDWIHFKSKRMGITAYTTNGKVVEKTNKMFPVFIQKKEFEDFFKEKEINK